MRNENEKRTNAQQTQKTKKNWPTNACKPYFRHFKCSKTSRKFEQKKNYKMFKNKGNKMAE